MNSIPKNIKGRKKANKKLLQWWFESNTYDKKNKKIIEALARHEPAIYDLQARRANHYTTRNITIYVW